MFLQDSWVSPACHTGNVAESDEFLSAARRENTILECESEMKPRNSHFRPHRIDAGDDNVSGACVLPLDVARNVAQNRLFRLSGLSKLFVPFAILLVLAGENAWAVDVSVAGVFSGKALLMIDGDGPRTVRIGETTAEGVKVAAIDGDSVTLEVEGKRRVLRVGQVVASQKTNTSGVARLSADGSGHFFANATINAQNIRLLVDTGATMISIGASDARRMQLDTRQAPMVQVHTANGQTTARLVKLATVQVGGITMHNVDALVHSHDMPIALLGMNFLSRTEISQDGSIMVLKRKY